MNEMHHTTPMENLPYFNCELIMTKTLSMSKKIKISNELLGNLIMGPIII